MITHEPLERESPRPSRSPGTPRRREPSLDRLFLNRRGEVTWDQMTGFRDGRRRKGHQLIFWSWIALAIDAAMVTSMSAFFLLAFALVVRSWPHSGAVITFSAAFVGITWVYLVASRVMYGRSLGEWACDLRLGQPTQRYSKDYPIKVISRASLILLTGIVTIPLLSLLTGRDVAGQISGLKIVSLT